MFRSITKHTTLTARAYRQIGRGSVVLEGDPLSGQYVVLAADREEFLQKQGILQALEKGCQAKGTVLGTSSPTLEVIDKPGDYRYDLTQFPHRGFLLTQGLPPTEIEQLSPTELF